MNITQRLMELDPSLERHNEGHWNEPYNPGMPGFSSFNDAGIEIEVGEFLYSLIRVLKPRRVLETGTHHGIGASYMGQALKDNGNGDKLHTVEFLPEIHNRAIERFGQLELHNTIEAYLMDVKDFNPGTATYGLILLDTEPQTRFKELLTFFPHLEPGGLIFIHDLHRHMHQIENQEHGFAWPYGEIPTVMKDLVRSGQLRPIHFSTPRGLTGFYKPHPEDYKWGS